MPHVEIPSTEIKVVLLGSSHTGKTSLVTRFSEGYYRENSRPATVGASFVTKRIAHANENVKVQIWDTAGAAHFKPMACMFYKDASAVIVCYDVCCETSFEEMRGWLEELRVKASQDLVVAIAGLKADLLDTNYEGGEVVPQSEVEELADTLGVIYVPTSAKSNHNVNLLFQNVADEVLLRRREARKIMIQKNNSEENVGESCAMNGGQDHVLEHRDAMEVHPSGRDSPRRSKYDKQRSYRVNTTEAESSQKTPPPRTPKSGRSKTRITVDKKKRSGSRTPRRSNRDNTLLEDEMEIKTSNGGYGCCQPVGCGAGEGVDGGSGCIVS